MLHTVFTPDNADLHLLCVCEIAGGFCAPGAAALLQPGDTVDLVRERDNKFDPYAVRVERVMTKLGYIPGRTGANINRVVCAVIDSPYRLPVVCFVRQVHEGADHPRGRVHLGVYVDCSMQTEVGTS
jgi:hypothetical protein